MQLIKLYQDLEHMWKNLTVYDDIITNLRTKEDGILAVLNNELPPNELMEKYKYPALLNEDNGILYAHEIPNKRQMFMIVWKNRVLYPKVMEYNLEATGVSTKSASDKQTECEEKIDQNEPVDQCEEKKEKTEPVDECEEKTEPVDECEEKKDKTEPVDEFQ